jgi:hypothetical protein
MTAARFGLRWSGKRRVSVLPAAVTCGRPVPVCVAAGAHTPPCRCQGDAGHEGTCWS